MSEHPLLAFALLAALCGICQWLAWRLKQPSIVFLLMAGLIVGPVTNLLNPNELFGDLLFPFVSVSVAIILFEGGLTLKMNDIKGHGSVVMRLITLGVLITWVLLAVAVHYIFDLSWPIAFVFGSITVVSGPTVIKPLLRAVRPNAKISHLLHWEGILIDPVGVFLALLVFEYVLLGQPGIAAPKLLFILTKLIVTGTILGLAGGFAATYMLRHYLVPDYLKNVLTLMFVVVMFAISETIQHESGLLAVTIMGIYLANARGLHVDEILHFKENLTVILISTLFIVLAARLDLSALPYFGAGLILLILVAQFIIRPINVFFCTLGSDLNKRERIFLGWIAPRGIIAAAVSSLFALRLQEANVPQTEFLVPLTFSLIVGTVVLQSFTAKPLADKLGISNPEPHGVLIHGISTMSLKLATALREHAIKVRFSDTSWSHVRKARQSGFEAYHGNPTSGHAEENLDLQGIGKLIALSENRDTNALAGIHFRQEFGSNAVFTLESASEDDAYERFDTANRHRANALFDSALNHGALQRRLRESEIKHLLVPEEVDAEEKEDVAESDLPEQQNNKTDVENKPRKNTTDELLETDLKLFAVSKEGELHIYGSDESFTLKPGWTLIVSPEPTQTNVA